MSLKNLDNFPLRLRIILEELTPVELSSMTEDVFHFLVTFLGACPF